MGSLLHFQDPTRPTLLINVGNPFRSDAVHVILFGVIIFNMKFSTIIIFVMAICAFKIVLSALKLN